MTSSKSWRDECGVFGVWNHAESARMTYLGLYALQHRGQESCGIVTLCEGEHLHHKAIGRVADRFDEKEIDRLKGNCAIGHVRYSTTGENLLTNAQPLTANIFQGPIALAHNGNIVNAEKLRKELTDQGAIFQGTNDTEVLLHLLSRDRQGEFHDKLFRSVSKLEGAFSLVLLTSNEMIVLRDPMGFRPLSLGKLNGSWVVASESCAFDLIGAKFERDVAPGEILIINDQGLKSLHLPKAETMAQCIFEHVYFSRPDSVVFGQSVYESRKNMGRILAREKPIDADIIVPVPDSGIPSALGFSEESKIPFELGIVRNHYVGRTFIEPKQSIRSFGVKVKLNPMSAILSGKRVVVVDDSLVRGTTSQKIISLVRNAGAKEVHLRIAAPPTIGSCYYGVDTPRVSELIASHKSESEIREFVGADTIGYLSVQGLKKAVPEVNGRSHCVACFTGKYPTPLYL